MSNGKGDSYRPVDREKFDANYDAIFGKKAKKKVAQPTKGQATRQGQSKKDQK